MTQKSQVRIYQTEDGKSQVDVHFNQETTWLSQAQMTELFGRNQSVISRHISNALKEEEVSEQSNMQKMHTAHSDKPVAFYDLDVVISVGYRVKSQRGVQFRRWATQILRQHLVQGYTLNQTRFKENAEELQQALALIHKVAQSPELTSSTGRGLVEIMSRYTQTFLWLQRYDEGLLDEPSGKKGGVLPSSNMAMQALNELKASLISRGEATALFAQPRDVGLSGIFGNLEQTIFGEPAYATIESKAAHLLYFVVKNHPFSDGNKRSGAFLFIDFLHRNKVLFNAADEPVINDTGLAALTLLVAESDPKQKETLIHLIMHMLSSNAGCG